MLTPMRRLSVIMLVAFAVQVFSAPGWVPEAPASTNCAGAEHAEHVCRTGCRVCKDHGHRGGKACGLKKMHHKASHQGHAEKSKRDREGTEEVLTCDCSGKGPGGVSARTNEPCITRRPAVVPGAVHRADAEDALPSLTPPPAIESEKPPKLLKKA